MSMCLLPVQVLYGIINAVVGIPTMVAFSKLIFKVRPHLTIGWRDADICTGVSQLVSFASCC